MSKELVRAYSKRKRKVYAECARPRPYIPRPASLGHRREGYCLTRPHKAGAELFPALHLAARVLGVSRQQQPDLSNLISSPSICMAHELSSI